MLKLRSDLLLQLANAGYTPARLRRERLLSESTIQRLREPDPNITMRSLATICELLGSYDVFAEDNHSKIARRFTR